MKEIFRRAKIVAMERGSALRQRIIDARRYEITDSSQRSRHRVKAAPVKLAADAPLSPDDVKQLDSDAVAEEPK